MTTSDILVFIGILLIMYSGCLSLMSSFIKKDVDIANRPGATLRNETLYKSTIAQKYFNRSSFFLIIIGSFVLLSPYIFGELLNQKITNAPQILGVLICLLILTLYAILKFTFYKVDLITIANQIQNLSSKKSKIHLSNYNLNLIIRILKQRNIKTDFTDVDEVQLAAVKYFKL